MGRHKRDFQTESKAASAAQLSTEASTGACGFSDRYRVHNRRKAYRVVMQHASSCATGTGPCGSCLLWSQIEKSSPSETAALMLAVLASRLAAWASSTGSSWTAGIE